jgi:molybdopterin biosynthesis enzyme
VCFELFVRPAIEILSGRHFSEWNTISASLSHPFDHGGGRVACLPAQLLEAMGQGESASSRPSSWRVALLSWHGSADIASLTRANALALLPAQPRQYQAGERLAVFRL